MPNKTLQRTAPNVAAAELGRLLPKKVELVNKCNDGIHIL